MNLIIFSLWVKHFAATKTPTDSQPPLQFSLQLNILLSKRDAIKELVGDLLGHFKVKTAVNCYCTDLLLVDAFYTYSGGQNLKSSNEHTLFLLACTLLSCFVCFVSCWFSGGDCTANM